MQAVAFLTTRKLMKYINGIPLREDTEADRKMMSSLTGLLGSGSTAFTAGQTNTNNSGAFADSPFGENWDAPLILDGDNPAPEQNQQPADNYWLYRLTTDTDGVALIEQYKKNAPFEEYSGKRGDGIVDTMIFYEKDSDYNYFGSICFVRMNKAIRRYISERSTNRSPAWLAEGVVSCNKGKAADADYVPIDKDLLEAAIEYELNKNSLIKKGAGAVEKYIADQLHSFAEDLRSQKYAEVRYNPALKDYDPIVRNLSSLTETKAELEAYTEKQGKRIRNFWNFVKRWSDAISINLLKIAAFITDLWSAVLDLLSFIASALDKIDIAAEAINAFICGAINQLFDTAATFTDLIAALPYITDKEKRLLAEEGLENAIDKFLSEGVNLKERLRRFWDALAVRYDSKKPSWLIAYQLGEDAVEVILWIDLVKGIIDIIRSLPKMFNSFKNWAEGVMQKAIKPEDVVLLEDPIALSKRIAALLKDKTVLQSTDKLDELYETAKIANEELRAATEKFAKETNGKAGLRPEEINGGLKDKARALEKITADYEGNAAKLLDIAGSKVVYETIEDLYKGLQKFVKEFDILKFKDRILNPLSNGYRDILINIKMNNGHIVEFRLHLKVMDEAAAIEHDSYKVIRSIEAKAEGRKLTIEEFNKIQNLNTKSKKLYDEAWKKIIDN